MVMANLDFAVRYPFTSAAKELLKSNGITVSEHLTTLAVERILAALNNTTKRTSAIHESEKLEEIASYAVARMLLSYAKTSYIINKFAIAEAKRASSYLSNANSGEFKKIAEEFGVNAQQDENGLSIPLVIYLKFSPRSSPYRLVNRDLAKGHVKSTSREWVRLTEEAIKIHIEKIPQTKDASPEIKNAVKQLMARLPKVQASYHIDKTSSPPCIDALLEDARQHKNLPHQARWYLAVYFIKKGASDEDLLKIFSLLPDYDEKITKYQVAHARKQGYSVPSCATVLSYGLCRARCGIRNPLEWRGKTPDKLLDKREQKNE